MGNLLGLEGEGNQEGDASSSAPLGQQQLEYMTSRVKEVLPQVPTDVIRKDVSLTANVDETITRLLDGTVTYQSETAVKRTSTSGATSSSSGVSSAVTSTASSSSQPQGCLITAASTFAKTPSERHKSFEERKKLLIEFCRQRYMEKKGILPAMSDRQQQSSS